MQDVQPVRWGIVGTGDISASVVPDISRCGNAVVAAICSRDNGRAQEFAAKHSIPTAYGDLGAMLGDSDIDAVYIGTPHGTHHAFAKAALEAGKHVVVEKPMALDSVQVLDLIDTARRADRFLMEAMWTKFNPAIQEIQQLIKDGGIGDVRSVQAAFGAPFPRDRGSRWSAELGGSALLDQGIYPVLLARMVLGEPEKVAASSVPFAPGVDATEWMTFEYPDQRFALLASSMVEWIDPSASINGTEGWIRLDPPFWATSAYTIYSGEPHEVMAKPERRLFTPEGNGYVPMLRAASEAITSGAKEHPIHPLRETLATFTLLDRIRDQFNAEHTQPGRQPVPSVLPTNHS
jgi:predicted dehydrogenase